jgi:two-component system, chemotaxis family, chemotaxis protein CheY
VDGPLVLVVEDDTDTRDLIAEVLREDGYQVVVAAHGREALVAVHSLASPPSIILLDLMMPVMNGWQFLEERTHDPSLATVPVLVLSADPTRRLAAQQGVVAVIGKPFDLSRLLRLVRAVTKAQAPSIHS